VEGREKEIGGELEFDVGGVLIVFIVAMEINFLMLIA
jgi:hypothetical protein